MKTNETLNKEEIDLFLNIIRTPKLNFLHSFFNGTLRETHLSDNLIITDDSIHYTFIESEEIKSLKLSKYLQNKKNINFILEIEQTKINDKKLDFMKIWKNLEH